MVKDKLSITFLISWYNGTDRDSSFCSGLAASSRQSDNKTDISVSRIQAIDILKAPWPD